ncbi:MAG: SDR family oxidoreductase [Caldilineaceae bacterium]
MVSLPGRVAVVTGGASGMGAATARELAAKGRDRWTCADGAAAVAAEIGAPAPITGDVSRSAFCNDVIARVIAAHGRLDILVNAAGIIKRTDVIATSDEAWRQIFGVNVDGIFFMCRAALPHMQAQRRGVIINFGSIWGDIGATGVARTAHRAPSLLDPGHGPGPRPRRQPHPGRLLSGRSGHAHALLGAGCAATRAFLDDPGRPHSVGRLASPKRSPASSPSSPRTPPLHDRRHGECGRRVYGGKDKIEK